MHATLRWRGSDRRMDGSPFVWPCAIALASLSTDNSQIFHGLAGAARNRVKRCIVFRSAGPRVGVDDEYVCTYVSHSVLCSDSHVYQQQDGLQQISQGHKPEA
ncbi:hypothetical protein P692DRAFT_201793253 [Suillus brevipes Sb2]|nr:hypothetical protein P692DRAFT_201793253 [Suillus brevipes Sb2]